MLTVAAANVSDNAVRIAIRGNDLRICVTSGALRKRVRDSMVPPIESRVRDSMIPRLRGEPGEGFFSLPGPYRLTLVQKCVHSLAKVIALIATEDEIIIGLEGIFRLQTTQRFLRGTKRQWCVACD